MFPSCDELPCDETPPDSLHSPVRDGRDAPLESKVVLLPRARLEQEVSGGQQVVTGVAGKVVLDTVGCGGWGMFKSTYN